MVGTKVTADFEDDATVGGIERIYKKLAKDGKIDEDGEVEGTGGSKDAIEYAIDSYVMNTFARYMGAFGHGGGSPVKTIKFGSDEYSWNNEKNLTASNWFNGDTSLVSAVVTQQETSIRDVTLTLVDDKNNSIEMTFAAKNVPTKEEYILSVFNAVDNNDEAMKDAIESYAIVLGLDLDGGEPYTEYPYDFWDSRGISVANFVLENRENVKDDSFESIDDIKAAFEAGKAYQLALRAFSWAFVGGEPGADNGALDANAVQALKAAVEAMAEFQGIDEKEDDEYKELEAVMSLLDALLEDDFDFTALNDAIGKEGFNFNNLERNEMLGFIGGYLEDLADEGNDDEDGDKTGGEDELEAGEEDEGGKEPEGGE
ncbi:MAG: hypothetical protein GX996_05910 [Firmicutes bacterium]|nr:hypothetical protein [Bacillota bacterium]